MTLRVGDVDALAEFVSAELARDDLHAALRQVAEFIWDVDHVEASQRQALLGPRPRHTGRPEWDALVAGVVEMLANRHGLRPPAWTIEADRFLETWWFFSDRPGWMVSAFTNAPAELANRGVFLHASALESV